MSGQSSSEERQLPAYSACVLTFRRPESLERVIACLLEQAHPPSMVTVVDNDPDESARVRTEALTASVETTRIEYLPTGSNLGPAGGWRRGVEAMQTAPLRGDWVAVFDDDDPISGPAVMGALLSRAQELSTKVQLGALGLRGARLNRRLGRLHRVRPSPHDWAVVDYLASNGAPIYSWKAIEDAGFFDERLFFGFEDLDLGLRMQRAGWVLATVNRDDLHEVEDTAPSRTAWREYYKTRSFVWISRREAGVFGTAVYALRSVVGGSLLLVRGGNASSAAARCWGALDGWRGRLGRHRYEPRSNPPKGRTSPPSA